ncbi:leucine-rich repeat neuronal protein 4-like [Myxocyprinus asiaticus]|uniref:leucine-rich repeat neuronal protein 4-like n=1 Tax=Myxocyprinus asiaticus TaxID=70543 RepID=UPI002223103B|nr:leucine-rich repeat neuronal protein 4-like [Myxocyprinus asiaticus]
MLMCGHPLILLLLLFIIINLLNLSFVMTSSPSQNDTRARVQLPGDTEDYNESEDITTQPSSSSTTQSKGPKLQCFYDMCVEQQEPCLKLSFTTGCLCPGLSGSNIPPSAPYNLKFSQEDSKGVVVHWCAPTSVVTHYVIWVQGKDKQMERNIEVEEQKRTAVLGNVAAGVHVCVEAVNTAGRSGKESQSCDTFEPHHPDSGLALKLGIIGGVVGLIMVLVLVLLLLRHKTWQKTTARTEAERRADEVL